MEITEHEIECNVLWMDQHGRPKMPPWTCNCDKIQSAYTRGHEDGRLFG